MMSPRSIFVGALLAASAPVHADDEPSHAVVETGAAPSKREPTGRFELGAGFSSDDGFLAHAGVVQDDLFRTGQRLALTADLSAIHQSFRIAHEVPDLLGTGFELRSEMFSTRRTYPGFTREGAGGAVTLGRRLDRNTRIYARYQIERVAMDVGELNGAATRMLAPNLGEGILASLGVGIAYNTLDAPVLARHGTRLELFAERADRRLGSEYQLDRVGGLFEHARPLGPFTLRLHGHASLVRSRDPMGVPLAHRLQHDGHAEVRGYALDQGNLVGDNLEAIGRIELELPIWRKAGISIAGFADAGLRHNSDMAWGPTSSLLQRSAGVSIIWRSPIGPLRFDVAVPLDGADRERQFLFSFGGAF